MPTVATLAASLAAFALQASAQQFVMYTPGGDDTSVERIDPILAPGKISQHVHQVFGSNALAPEVTYEDLLQSSCTTVADASNHGNSADHSLYWHPALYMEASNGTGYVKVPTNGHKLYYKDAGSPKDKKADPFEFPHGFRMIAGNPWIRSPPTDVQRQNITQWICHGSNGMNQGTSGGFPTGVTDCPEVDGFNGAIHYPHCWNGDDFDPANPQAHVVYPDGDIQNGDCPSSHPTRLPHIFIENTFDIHAIVDQVKPDSFVLAMGDNTGLGWHADFFNGWEDGAISALLASCPAAYYGNEDVGVCTAFKAAATPANQCKLNGFYAEKVNFPGQNLPGCNPIEDSDPAPVYATAPQGTYSTDCTLANDSGSNAIASNSSAVSSASSNSTASSAVSSQTYTQSTTSVSSVATSTLTTSTSVAPSPSTTTTTLATSIASSSSSTTRITVTTSLISSVRNKGVKRPHTTQAPSSSLDYDVVTVTEFVTMTGEAPSKRHLPRHQHAHHHQF